MEPELHRPGKGSRERQKGEEQRRHEELGGQRVLTPELGQPGSRELARKRWTWRPWVAEHQSISFGSVITEVIDKVCLIPLKASTLGNLSLGCCKIRPSYHPEGSFLQ
jgi:hypothetical protein